MDLWITSKLLILYVFTIHKYKWIYCSDDNPDQPNNPGDNNEIDKNSESQDKDKGEASTGPEKEDETRVNEKKILIIEGRIPMTLDIKQFRSTNRYQCHKNKKNVTFIAKPWYCFNVLKSGNNIICTLSALDCAHRVIVFSKGSPKKRVKLDLLNGSEILFQKDGRGKPWKEITAKSHELAKSLIQYFVSLLDLENTKKQLRNLNEELDSLFIMAEKNEANSILRSIVLAGKSVERLMESESDKDVSNYAIDLIKKFALMEKQFNSIDEDMREVLNQQYQIVKIVFGEFFQHLKVYKVESESKPEPIDSKQVEPKEPQEPERIEAEIESDED